MPHHIAGENMSDRINQLSVKENGIDEVSLNLAKTHLENANRSELKI